MESNDQFLFLPGAEALSKSPLVGELLKKQEEDGRMVAAICAGDYENFSFPRPHGLYWLKVYES